MPHANLVVAGAVAAGPLSKRATAQPSESDDYTRYELVAPETAQFRIVYEVNSYFVEGDRLVFSRSLGVRRNSVVLPPGHELVACNVPAQALQEADGRIKVSFVNPDRAQATG